MNLKFNKRAQHEYYGGGATILIEGVVIKKFVQGANKEVMEFHLYIYLMENYKTH